VRGERVQIGQDRQLADHLRVHILAQAGVESVVVERPLVGVALLLPEWANAAEVARAIDAERVTAGFLDFQSRCCVAVPAGVAHLEQTAHAVAKVIHGLLEIHTPYINTFADECPDPPVLPPLDDSTILVTACAIVETASVLTEHLQALRHQNIPVDIQQVLGETLDLVRLEVNAARQLIDAHGMEGSL
jgi:hypothetical protein